MLKKVLLIIIFIILNFNIVNAGGFNTANNYGIDRQKEQVLNKILSKVSVKILNTGGKKSLLYKIIFKRIELLEKKYKNKKKLINLLKYIKDRLNLACDTFGKSFGKEDEIMMQEFINNYFSSLGDYGKRKDLDIKTIKKYKKIYIDLFKKNKLPILHKIEIGGNKIFVTGAYRNYYTNENTKDCGEYFTSIGADGYELCVGIIEKKDGSYDVNAGSLVYVEGDGNIEKYNNNYLIVNYINGDGCWFGGKYKLLDKNLNILNTLNISVYSCDIAVSEFNIGKFYIGFYSGLDQNFVPQGNISYKIFEKNLKSDGNYVKKVKEYKLTNGSKLTFDYKKNLLSSYFNGNIIFKIGNKNYKKSILNIESKKTLFIEKYISILKLLELKKIGNNYKIIGTFSSDAKNKVKKIEILSCYNNLNIYNNRYYKLNNFKNGDKNFVYNISKKFGNLCKIPYILKITTKEGNIIKKEFVLEK